MIVCSIDGKRAYPLTDSKIKITTENPFIKDSGEYTYEISFPMSIVENRNIFGNVQRLEASKAMPSFENCRIMVDNVPVMAGKGVVTSIDGEYLKMQIVGGKSRIKYNSKFEEHFIDEIAFPYVVVDKGVEDPIELKPGYGRIWLETIMQEFVGQEGVAVFVWTYDETRDETVNTTRQKTYYDRWGEVDYRAPYIGSPAVAPNLLYVLDKVMEFEGVKIVRNDIGKEPWNKLYIANAFTTVDIAKALPHWTVYYFLDEISKLFGVTFCFNDEASEVSILSKNEMEGEDVVAYECFDEFSCDIGEEDLKSSSTDNLCYSLDGSEERNWRDDISKELIKSFRVVEKDSVDDIIKSAEGLSKKRKLTTIFKVGKRYYAYWEIGEENLQLSRIGKFMALEQTEGSQNSTELHIVPVAFSTVDNTEGDSHYCAGRHVSTANHREGLMSQDDDDEDTEYVSVKDAIEGEEVVSEIEANSGTMGLFFCYADAGKWYTPGRKFYFNYFETEPVLDGYNGSKPQIGANEIIPSMELWNIHNSFNGEIGGKSLMQIKFLADGMPSARNIYVFKGKRYIVSKIETEIENGKISRLKTGYFYQME